MRAQDGKLAACDGVAQVDVLPGTHCHPLAIGAEGDRTGALLPFRQDGDLLAGGRVPQPARAGPRDDVRIQKARLQSSRGGNPAAVRVVRHEGVTIQVGWGDFCLEKGNLLARRRIPEADGLVVAAGCNLLAVGTVRHGRRRSRVPAEDGLEPAGGHVVKVNLVMVEAADGDLPARRAQDERLIFPPGTGSTRRGAVELAVEVLPFPVAVLLRRIFEGAASGTAVLKLQGGGRGGDIRPVAPPAFGFLVSLSLVALEDGLLLEPSAISGCEIRFRQDSRKYEAATIEPTVTATSNAVSTPPRTAITGLRRAHRQYRSAALTWRARIGSSARNRPRSSAIASADWYRALGSFSIAFRTIVSRSRGMRPSSDRGRAGSSFLICSISFSRSDVVEGRPERQQLVERQPQRVDVGAGVPLAPEPLGRHVAERAQDVAGVGQALVVPLGQAEVGDPDDPRVVEQEVARLDVAVDDAAGMGVGQPLRRLAADLGHAPEERSPAARELGRRDLTARPAARPRAPGAWSGRARPAQDPRERSPKRGSRPGPSRSVAAGPVAAAGRIVTGRHRPFGREPAGQERLGDPDRARAPARRSPRRPRSARGLPPLQASARDRAAAPARR